MKLLNKAHFFIIATLFFLLTAIVVLFMRFLPAKERAFRTMIAKMGHFLIGYKVEFQGSPDPDAKLFVLNHQSMLDILIFDEYLKGSHYWVAKQELGKIPLLGAGFKQGCILIDRKNPREIVHIIAAAKDKIEQGGAIMIFPEGTRGRGDKLLKFQPGAQIMANKLGLKVQPALIVGSRKAFDTKNFNIQSGVIKVIFLPSLLAQGEWLADVREQMAELLEQNLKSE